MSSTPYCKTCHKAGKSYHEYTNHWTRDKPGKDGNIICPVILNTVCNYCKEKGHWIKYCPVISNKRTVCEQPEERPTDETVHSWANILKRGLPYPTSYNNNTLRHAAGSGEEDSYMKIDISICDMYNEEEDTDTDISRPPSPDFPPPIPLYSPYTEE